MMNFLLSLLGQNVKQCDDVNILCSDGRGLQRERTERTSGTRDCRDKEC